MPADVNERFDYEKEKRYSFQRELNIDERRILPCLEL